MGNATANNSTHNARKSEGRNDRAKAREGKAREKERKTGEKEGEGTDSTDGRGTDGIGEKCEFVCGLATSSLSPAFAVVLEGKRASEGGTGDLGWEALRCFSAYKPQARTPVPSLSPSTHTVPRGGCGGGGRASWPALPISLLSER